MDFACIFLFLYVVLRGVNVRGEHNLNNSEVPASKRQFVYGPDDVSQMISQLSLLRYRTQLFRGNEDECNINKPCPKDQFCDVHMCRSCLHESTPCHFIGTCCQGFVCQYGQCTKGVKQGMPGTYCDKTSECDENSCCVRELSLSTRNSVCKPMLNEYESCGPINLFHQVYTDGRVEPVCGPCKQGLQCKNVGTKGLHYVCLKENVT